MAYKAFTRAAGLAVLALLISGGGIAAHAQVCDSANCYYAIDAAHDPAYQAAIHGGWYGYPYYYGNYNSYFSYPSYSYPSPSYNPYPYGSQYQYPQPSNSYWMNGCLFTTIQVNGVLQTTQACGY